MSSFFCISSVFAGHCRGRCQCLGSLFRRLGSHCTGVFGGLRAAGPFLQDPERTHGRYNQPFPFIIIIKLLVQEIYQALVQFVSCLLVKVLVTIVLTGGSELSEKWSNGCYEQNIKVVQKSMSL